MQYENIQVMISMPPDYKKRLREKAKKEGRTVSGMIRYWLDRDDRMEMKRIAKKGRVI